MRKQRELENDSDVLIECRDVYKSFGEKHILKGVSFKVFCCHFTLSILPFLKSSVKEWCY